MTDPPHNVYFNSIKLNSHRKIAIKVNFLSVSQVKVMISL